MIRWSPNYSKNRANAFDMKRFGLPEEQINGIKRIFSKYRQIDTVLIYGSRALGTHQPSSDIDLTLKGNDLNLSLLSKIEHDLDDLLLPCKFDITIYDRISNPDLLDHISRVGKEIYRRNDSGAIPLRRDTHSRT